MVRVIRDSKLSDRLRGFARSPFFLPFVLLILVVATIPVVSLLSSRNTDIRQKAATSGLTSTIDVTPDTGTVTTGQQFSVDLVIDGGGQPFNAARARINVSNNLTVQSVTLTPASSGGCNFSFANQNSTPKVSNPSFAGAILNGSSERCTLYTLNLTATGTGTGTVSITNQQVKSSVDNSEIFLSSKNGAYTIGTVTVPISQSVLSLVPNATSATTGQNFTVDVRVNTNGQTVNGVESDILYPQNLLSVVNVSSSNGDFSIEAQKTITPGKINIAYGSIVPKSGDLLVVRITFTPVSNGTADVVFENAAVVSDISNTNVLKNILNGVYVISGPSITIAPTNIPTTVPSTVPTIQTPTTTPVVPTPLPTSGITPTSTIAPTPTTVPTAAPTSSPGLSITLDSIPVKTYGSSIMLSGTKSTNITTVLINNSSIGVTYPSTSLWQYSATLAIGANTFSAIGRNSTGSNSNTTSTSINRNRIGDINGDDQIDLTDLSIFGSDWENSGALNDILSDMNNDNLVDLTDFSIFAKAYGN